jgi:hypothetical protein
MFKEQKGLLKSTKSVKKRTLWVSLGILLGLLVGESSGIIAARTASTITACINKKSSAMRYSSSGRCAKTESVLAWNIDGPTGSKGTAGDQGLQGPRGERGEAGLRGEAGERGAQGLQGVAGPAGAAGVSGVSPSWSATGFTARSVCGVNGTTLCALGLRGPGGGLIFYVDSDGEHPDFDYLEAAPADASSSANWSTTTSKCGPSISSSCQTSFINDAGSSLNFIAIGEGRSATAAVVARHDEGSVARSSYAAGIANAYSTAWASDWWLPSKNELALMYTNLKLNGLGGFALDYYWSSSEFNASNVWGQAFNSGVPANLGKSLSTFIRPVRGF